MRHQGQSGNNSDSVRGRSRGAIRTHLGRKRTGPRRHDAPGQDAFERRRQEELFDRMRSQFEQSFQRAGEKTLAAIDSALDTAFDGLVAAGELTAENGERVRQWLKRDILHRDKPDLTFRTGDITTAGTITCAGCEWTIRMSRTSLLPQCPQCGETTFRKLP